MVKLPVKNEQEERKKQKQKNWVFEEVTSLEAAVNTTQTQQQHTMFLSRAFIQCICAVHLSSAFKASCRALVH
jgi:predicted ATPase